MAHGWVPAENWRGVRFGTPGGFVLRIRSMHSLLTVSVFFSPPKHAMSMHE